MKITCDDLDIRLLRDEVTIDACKWNIFSNRKRRFFECREILIKVKDVEWLNKFDVIKRK